MNTNTIFALSSGAPPSAIAILRISGPAAGAVLDVLVRPGARPKPRQAALRTLRDAAGETLDHALVLWFPGPTSVTGEDMAELHLHGSRAVVAAVGAAVAAHPGTRLAEPGEFTRRSLENGRIDLGQAEGLADLLSAETDAQRKAALRSAEGGVGREVAHWLDQLTEVAAMVEAELDYADEIDPAQADSFEEPLRILAQGVRNALDRPPVERLQDGVRVTIAGPPNVGKSSLINALAGRDVAITADLAGTTRDVIETTVTHRGSVFVLSDTAGLHENTTDPIEAIGMARARALVDQADVLLWLGDDPPPRLAVWLYPRADSRPAPPRGRMPVSTRWPSSIEQLWSVLQDRAEGSAIADQQQLYNARQRARASEALDAIRAAMATSDMLIKAEELRRARRSFVQLAGYDEVDTVLDALFARFCLGK